MYYKTQMKRASTSSFLPCKAMKLKSPLLPGSNHQFNERDRETTPFTGDLLVCNKSKEDHIYQLCHCF